MTNNQNQGEQAHETSTYHDDHVLVVTDLLKPFEEAKAKKMAPVAIRCQICDVSVVYGRQAVMTCQLCKGRFHRRCLNLDEQVLQVYRKNGFKCEMCLRKNLSPRKETITADPSSAKGIGNEPEPDLDLSNTELLESFERILNVKMHDVVYSLRKDLLAMSHDMNELKEENADLKDMIVRGLVAKGQQGRPGPVSIHPPPPAPVEKPDLCLSKVCEPQNKPLIRKTSGKKKVKRGPKRPVDATSVLSNNSGQLRL